MKDYIPSPEELSAYELAYNMADDRLSLKTDSGLVQDILISNRMFVDMPSVDGVPIIESGTNWIKYSEGTMMVFGDIQFTASVALASGALFTNTATHELKFTVPFVGAFPKVFCDSDASQKDIVSVRAGDTSLTGFSPIVFATTNGITSPMISFVAIGRWK